MFPQASVSHSVHRGRGGVSIPGPMSFSGGLVCAGRWVLTPPDMGPLGVTHPPLLSPSGSHHAYSRHVGGTHPTGMLSCC